MTSQGLALFGLCGTDVRWAGMVFRGGSSGDRCARRAPLGRWLVAACVLSGCRTAEPSGLAVRCRDAVEARRDTAADLCLASYAMTHDAATGARAARALQNRDGEAPVLEWIAGAVGDSPAGADAWFALGVNRLNSDDFAGALAAYQRAGAHRAQSDVPGRMHDAMGLLGYYQYRGDYQPAAQQAAIAYELVGQLAQPDDRAVVYVNLAGLMLELGNPAIASQIIEEARRVVPPTSRYYGRLLQREAGVEKARDHAALERQALREAHAFAERAGDRDLEWNTRINLVDAALRGGAVDEAAALLDAAPLARDAGRNDRAVDAYYRGEIAIARGEFAAAARGIERALPGAPETWIAQLEGVRGRAWLLAGAPDEAERALVHAVEATERKRGALDRDTFKSWLLAKDRAPFEDLFLLYVAAHRLQDAFAVVQRATARSTLDGLLKLERAEPSPARSIAAAGERFEGMRTLARSLRASPASAIPPVASLLDRLRGSHVVTYFRARGELWAIWLARDGALAARRIGDIAELAARAAAWRHAPEDAVLAGELGEALLPDDLLPPPGAPLVIVPDDPVAELSFAALRRGGEPVVAHHPVAYGPSAAVLSFARRAGALDRAIVLGDPTDDLPQARREAEEVAGALHVTPRLGAAAVRSALLDAGPATLVHVAAHTAATPAGPALRLADGLLDAGAILERGARIGAVVLLTCSSAAPAGRDELAPLASAFVAAGAHTVIAARGAIEDDIGRRFAKLFYQAGGVIDPVGAVAAAQRQLAAEHVAVAQWSTFLVIGGIP